MDPNLIIGSNSAAEKINCSSINFNDPSNDNVKHSLTQSIACEFVGQIRKWSFPVECFLSYSCFFFFHNFWLFLSTSLPILSSIPNNSLSLLIPLITIHTAAPPRKYLILKCVFDLSQSKSLYSSYLSSLVKEYSQLDNLCLGTSLLKRLWLCWKWF